MTAVTAALADVRSYVREASDRLRAELGLPLRYPAPSCRVYVWDEEVARAGAPLRSWRDEMREATVFEFPLASLQRALAAHRALAPAPVVRLRPNTDEFVAGLAAIRAQIRLGMELRDPRSFVAITEVS